MAVKTIDIEEFLKFLEFHPVLDVRSPSEYNHAHMPGAHSFPLFSDEERRVVGTTYKQRSREDAIKIGLDYFGPKMREMIEKTEMILEGSEEKTLLIHCWRGGMRSAAVAWLMDLYGFNVYLLKGGYKAFRKWVLAYFDNDLPMRVIGGYTGSGKTEILQALKSKDEFVLDLEAIAGHRGSAFGNLGLPEQPGIEQFENTLAIEIMNLNSKLNLTEKKWIWTEDESRRIGNINLPEAFHFQLKKSRQIFLKVPFEKRLDTILRIYGDFPSEKLEDSILRIKKRMGFDQNTLALNYLKDGKVRACFEILLNYYDRYYTKSSTQWKRESKEIDLKAFDANSIADFLIKIKDNL